MAYRWPLLPAGAVALSAALWGLWWLPLRALADDGAARRRRSMPLLYGATSLALLPWFWRRRRRLAAGGRLLLGAGGLFGAALVSWNLALILGEVVRVTLLFYLAPIWATLLAVALLGERVGTLRLVSVLLGLAGALVLLGLGGGLPLPRSAGDWLGLAAGLLFALSMTLVRKGQAIEGLEQTMVSCAAATLLSLLLMAVLPAPGSGSIAPGVLASSRSQRSSGCCPAPGFCCGAPGFLEPGGSRCCYCSRSRSPRSRRPCSRASRSASAKPPAAS